MKKPSVDQFFTGVMIAIFVAFFIGMIFWAVSEDKEYREISDNQVRCETIGADYIAELDQCVIDNKIVEVPGR